MKQSDFFIAIYLANNEYGLCFVIPDSPWVDGELRRLIEDIQDRLPESFLINHKESRNKENRRHRMKALKSATCSTLSGKSTLTYQIGLSPESIVHLRISKNSGGGFFSDEWIALDDILDTPKKRPESSPVLSHFLTPLLKGKSVNTSAFILAVMTHLKLIRPLPKKKRQHELLDPMPFLDRVTQLMTAGKTGRSTRKTAAKATGASTVKAAGRKTGGNAAIKKAAV